ncbi:ABC transporter permease [Alloiococcus sp. CFN-8]|uniref:ABC transporter permease n=1 Tax=Alloiococcus sp. CFN-8 TaxID=3416081 RepID=UPI003CED0084
MNVTALLNSLPGSIAQGLIWGIMALGLYISYKLLDYADLTVDGSLCTGGAVAAICIINGVSPWIAIIFAALAGMAAGAITGILHTALGIPAILSGILTQLALYSINMRIMGKANITVSVTEYDLLVSIRYNNKSIIIGVIFVAALVALMYWFFGTELGSALRATGNNPNMSRAQGINTNVIKVLGLTLSNGLVGLSGGLYAQYQGNADINMGRGAIVIGLASIIIGEVIIGARRSFAVKLTSAAIGSIIYYIVIAVVLWLGLSTQDLKLFSAVTVAVFLSIPYIKSNYKGRLALNIRREGRSNA